MAVRMLELIEHVEDDDDARVLAITGAGSMFCTGFDDGVDPRLVESLAVLSKPTVAIINGAIRPPTIPASTPRNIRRDGDGVSVVLVGAGVALRLMLTGMALGADEAMRTGLIAYLADSRIELAALSGRVAGAILSRAPLAARLVKDAVLKGYDMTLEQGIRLEEDLYALLQTTADRAEGVRAFLEKRRPLFRGA